MAGKRIAGLIAGLVLALAPAAQAGSVEVDLRALSAAQLQGLALSYEFCGLPG